MADAMIEAESPLKNILVYQPEEQSSQCSDDSSPSY
jgi:hypothetical protein